VVWRRDEKKSCRAEIRRESKAKQEIQIGIFERTTTKPETLKKKTYCISNT
jgi:hypothetical protein